MRCNMNPAVDLRSRQFPQGALACCHAKLVQRNLRYDFRIVSPYDLGQCGQRAVKTQHLPVDRADCPQQGQMAPPKLIPHCGIAW